MFVDACLHLPGDILLKVDRAAMAVSLETRVPFLDLGIAVAACQIPTLIHFADGRREWLLRQLLQRHVRQFMFDRPKRGFQVPIAKWSRTELCDWFETLLAQARSQREGFFDLLSCGNAGGSTSITMPIGRSFSGRYSCSRHGWNTETTDSCKPRATHRRAPR